MSMSVSRDVILGQASGLRDRILKGECPYPDAALEANETFLARVQDQPAQIDLDAARKAAARSELLGYVAGVAAVAGGVALAVYGFTCPPLLGSAVAAASGAVAVRTLFRMSGRQFAELEARKKFADQLEAWSMKPTSDPPRVIGAQGRMTVASLKMLTRGFPQDVRGFPYASEMLADHERLMKLLPADGAVSVDDVKQGLLEASRRPMSRAADSSVKAGSLLANAGWVAGAAALASGHPYIALGLFGAMAVGRGLDFVFGGRADQGALARRDARSLHYWQQAMAAAPPATTDQLVFGSPATPRQDPGSIERSQEDVKLGKIKVPVKRKGATQP